MSELDYNNRNRRWMRYHEFEMEQKRRFLQKLSEADSFKIFKELHKFGSKLVIKSRSNEPDMAKIKTLAKVHSIFSKVK